MWKLKGKIAFLVGSSVILVEAPLLEPAAAAEKAPRIGAAEMRILASLDDTTTIEFIEEPLAHCVDFWKDLHDIEIQIDKRALEDVGIDTDEPITKIVEGVSLRSALNLILRDLGLDWTIANEVLLITSPEEAEMNLVTRVYDVGDLVTVQDTEGKRWRDFDSMIDTITSTIEPEDWEDVGGPGSIASFEIRGAAGLVVRHTPKVHQKLTRLLMDLTDVADKYGSDVYPTHDQVFFPEGQGFGGGMMGMGGGGMMGMGGGGMMGMGGGGMVGMGGGFGPAPPACQPACSPSEPAKQE